MKNASIEIRVTQTQAKALAKLIQFQLSAYEEADPAALGSEGVEALTVRFRSPPEPFTGRDLDGIAPLLAMLELY